MASPFDSLWIAIRTAADHGTMRLALQTTLLIIPLYIIGLGVYRISFHPLAKVPGPRLASFSYWYEFYYDCWLGGRYMFKLKELHQQYGPIVRINPNEVHINDADFYDTIYAAGGPKHPRWKIRHMAMHDDSMFETWDPALHRKRRAAVAPSFSKQSIRALEAPLGDLVDSYRARLAQLAGTDKVLEIHGFWNNLTQEVIGKYCFGTDDIKALRDGKEEAMFLGTFDNYPNAHQWSRHFPWVFDFLGSLPFSVLAVLDPGWYAVRDFMEQIRKQIVTVMAMDAPHVGTKNVFHELRDSKHLPAEDKHMGYYIREAVSFIGGGTETTAASLTTMSYHVLANPEVLRKLREELSTAMPEGSTRLPPLATLEALPYLTGCVNEGIRLSFGVPGRLPRVARTEQLEYKGYKLPPGTIMSQSSYLISTDERFFPEPYAFRPERWVESGKDLHSKFFPFSRGARMCVGLNLAYAELYLTAASVFPSVDMQLYETSDRDVEIVNDGFIGYRPRDSKGIRVKVSSSTKGNSSEDKY